VVYAELLEDVEVEEKVEGYNQPEGQGLHCSVGQLIDSAVTP